MYDLNALALSVKKRRRAFLVRAAVIIALIAISVLLIALDINLDVTFAATIVALVLIGMLVRRAKRFRIFVLFGNEIKGVNIKEHEVGIQRDPMDRIRRSRRPAMPHTFENLKEPPRKIRGTVFVRCEDGSIKKITGLGARHMEFYEDGDLLFKPSGAAFPLVLSRSPLRQPCPKCGAFNTAERSDCHSCALPILSSD